MNISPEENAAFDRIWKRENLGDIEKNLKARTRKHQIAAFLGLAASLVAIGVGGALFLNDQVTSAERTTAPNPTSRWYKVLDIALTGQLKTAAAPLSEKRVSSIPIGSDSGATRFREELIVPLDKTNLTIKLEGRVGYQEQEPLRIEDFRISLGPNSIEFRLSPEDPAQVETTFTSVGNKPVEVTRDDAFNKAITEAEGLLKLNEGDSGVPFTNPNATS